MLDQTRRLLFTRMRDQADRLNSAATIGCDANIAIRLKIREAPLGELSRRIGGRFESDQNTDGSLETAVCSTALYRLVRASRKPVPCRLARGTHSQTRLRECIQLPCAVSVAQGVASHHGAAPRGRTPGSRCRLQQDCPKEKWPFPILGSRLLVDCWRSAQIQGL